MSSRVIASLFMSAILVGCGGGSGGNGSSPATEVPPTAEPLGAQVSLDAGAVLGQEHPEHAVWEWLGIPFAEPPVGDLRWKAPRPVASWEGVREASSFGSECPQLGYVDGEPTGEEDCLYLNVWRPATDERDLPVYVWIHGGGNTNGSNATPAYQGYRLAERSNVVVVSIQYRLGPLGWLYHPALHSGDALDDSGNYGTLDIIQSLRWIRDNIEAFGGDPDNVIITGESAGAINAMSLLVSPEATGLFHKAIIQSGLPDHLDLDTGSELARSVFDQLTEGAVDAPTDSDIADTLRAASPAELLKAYNVPALFPFNDGTVLAAEGTDLFATGEHINKVPVIVGTTRDEFKLFTNPLFQDQFPGFPDDLRAAIGRYTSDLWRIHGADRFAAGLTAAPDQPDVYVYRFNWGSPNEEGESPLPGDLGETLGAHHALEITFVFGFPEDWIDPRGTALVFTDDSLAGRQNLSEAIMTYFADFAQGGNPNGSNLPAWEPFSVDGDFKAIEFDVNLTDDSARLTVDEEVYTIEWLLQTMEAELPAELYGIVLAVLQGTGWLDP